MSWDGKFYHAPPPKSHCATAEKSQIIIQFRKKFKAGILQREWHFDSFRNAIDDEEAITFKKNGSMLWFASHFLPLERSIQERDTFVLNDSMKW